MALARGYCLPCRIRRPGSGRDVSRRGAVARVRGYSRQGALALGPLDADTGGSVYRRALLPDAKG